MLQLLNEFLKKQQGVMDAETPILVPARTGFIIEQGRRSHAGLATGIYVCPLTLSRRRFVLYAQMCPMKMWRQWTNRRVYTSEFPVIFARRVYNCVVFLIAPIDFVT